jgi:predicted permease
MLSSLVRLAAADPGFDTSNMLVADLTFSRNGPSWEKPVPMREAIVERVGGLPGVESATIDCPPLNGFCWRAGVRSIDGRENSSDDDIGVHMVPDGFFETMDVPLRTGRTFVPADAEGTRPVVVINEIAARQLFGDGPAIGHTAAFTIDLTDEGREAEVIGVVGDVLQGRPADGARAEAYFSERQMSEAGGSLMVRTRGEPLDAIASVRAAVRDLDPSIVVDGVRTMEQSHASGLGDTRIVLVLLGLFAAIALVLAGAGIWGVVALTVAERRREIGLRMALGARADQLVGAVMRQGMTATLVGAFIGGWAAWGLSRLLSSLLFGTGTHDPVAFAGAAGVLLVGAALASLIPARQATRVDPARTLRTD